ncbi:MAG: hypothetical protein R3F17_05070 [Planctomycetota bacterium]
MGAWSGFLLGLGVSCLVLSSQARALVRKPAKVFETMLLGFLVKMMVLGAMASPSATGNPWRSEWTGEHSSLPQGAVMFLLALLGAVDTSGALRSSAAQRGGMPSLQFSRSPPGERLAPKPRF